MDCTPASPREDFHRYKETNLFSRFFLGILFSDILNFNTVALFHLHAVTFASLRLPGSADGQSGWFAVIQDPIWREIHFTMFSNSKMHLLHVSELPRNEKSPVPLVATLLLSPSKRVGGPQQSFGFDKKSKSSVFCGILFSGDQVFLVIDNCSGLLHRSRGLKIKIW